MDDKPQKFSKEKRRSPRVSGAMVEYFIQGEEHPEKKKAFIKDICIYGVCIYVPHHVDPEATLCLYIFVFGSNIPIFAKAKVAWQNPGEYFGSFNVGLEFIEMEEEGRKKLDEYIKSNLKED